MNNNAIYKTEATYKSILHKQSTPNTVNNNGVNIDQEVNCKTKNLNLKSEIILTYLANDCRFLLTVHNKLNDIHWN